MKDTWYDMGYDDDMSWMYDWKGKEKKMTREEAIARIKDHKIVHKINEPRAIYILEALDMAIQALEQESKTGHWITHEEQFNALGMAVKGGVRCSECGYTTHNKLHMEIGCPYKFCPNCGAKMSENPVDSKDVIWYNRCNYSKIVVEPQESEEI